MSKIKEIESAILELEGGAYQSLMDQYLYRKYGYRIVSFGSQIGTNKTVTGIPDTYTAILPSGKYVFIMYGTQKKAATKLKEDLSKCLEEIKKIGFEDKVEKIICCHTAKKLSPKIDNELRSMYDNLELIGITDTAHDLLYKYPEVAKFALNINITTNQILDEQDFINACSKNDFSTTLAMTLLFRSNECNDVVDLISKNVVTVISGKSGIGKTRLAIEAMRQYSSKHSCIVKYIKNNGEKIFDDVCVIFDDENDYADLIDDADQLTEINLLLEIAFKKNRKHDFRILITVRDYAYTDLKNEIWKYTATPAEYELGGLGYNEIKDILKCNLKINNIEYLDRISNIAKGNIRIALMAGKSSLETGTYENLENVVDIYNVFYSRVFETLDYKKRILIGLIAFLDRVFIDSEKFISVVKRYNISNEELHDILTELSSKEIVDIYKNRVVKFDNQKLSDYILYYVFIKERWLSLSEISMEFFENYFERICYGFSTLYSLFQSEEMVSYLRLQAKCIWTEIEKCPEMAEKFILEFIPLIPEEGMAFIKRRIEQLPRKTPTDFSKVDFTKSANGICKSKLLESLTLLKYTDYCDDSLSLILLNLEIDSENPTDYHIIFGKLLAIDYHSAGYGYRHDSEILSALIKRFKKENSTNLGYCLLFLIESDLRLIYENFSSGSGNTITIKKTRLFKCETVFKLRKCCFEALFSMRADKRFTKYINHILYHYPSGYGCDDESLSIMKQDMEVISNCFMLDKSNPTYMDCLILQHLAQVCENADINPSAKFCMWETNPIFVFCTDVFMKKLDSSFKYKLWETERNEKIKAKVKTFSKNEFEQIFICLNEIEIDKIGFDRYNAFIVLLNNVPSETFIDFTIVYLRLGQKAFNADGCISECVKRLLTIVDYKTAEDIISREDYSDNSYWLSELRSQIPDDAITDITINDILDNVIDDGIKVDQAYLINYQAIKRIDSLHNGFAAEYIRKIAGVDLPPLFCDKLIVESYYAENGFSTMLEIFCGNDIQILEKIYLTAIKLRDYFYQDPDFLTCILKTDPDFLYKLIDLEINSHSIYTSSVINVFWKLPDCKELAFKTIVYLSCDNSFEAYSALSEFIKPNNSETEAEKEIRLAVLKKIVDEFAFDDKFIDAFFLAAKDLPDNERLTMILEFCGINKNISAFRKCPISRKYYLSTDGSAYAISERIDFLKKVKTELKGIDFIEHREYLNNLIYDDLKRLDEAFADDFLYG